ncbi:hypothetical protein BJX64DRAFT_256780 [Aspergillus heterothallicus]
MELTVLVVLLSSRRRPTETQSIHSQSLIGIFFALWPSSGCARTFLEVWLGIACVEFCGRDISDYLIHQRQGRAHLNLDLDASLHRSPVLS